MVSYGIIMVVVGLFSTWPAVRGSRVTVGDRRRAIILWGASGVVLVVSGVVVAVTPVSTAEVFLFSGIGLAVVLVFLGTLVASRAARTVRNDGG
jgi:hypothetical protein